MDHHSNGHHNPWLVFGVVGLNVYMATLDSSAVNLILPLLSAEFEAPITRIEWVSTIYLLVICILLLPVGAVATRWGQDRIFRLGIFFFTFSSFLCAISTNLLSLIFSRTLQGIGAALTSALGGGIIASVFPESKRGMALGSIGMMVAAGSITGPILGGFVAGFWGWEAIFWINLPIGALTLFLANRWLPHFPTDSIRKTFDYHGLLIYSIVLILLLLSLSEAMHIGTLTTFVGFLLSVFLFLYFLHIERKHSTPMLPLHLFKNRLFTSSILFGLLNNSASIQSFLTMPFYLQHVRQFDVVTTGLFLTSWPLALAVIAPLSGRLTDRLGSRLPSFFGPIIQASGLLILSFLNETSSSMYILSGIVISGIGGAVFVPANNKMLLTSVPQKFLFIASSLMALIRNIGMVMGIAIAAALIQFFRHFTGNVQEDSGFLIGMHWSMLCAALFALITGIGTFLYTRKKD
ncbi:MAG: MFS transporter [bacterium]|nr:MFS transporter [bacterium]